MLRKELPDFRTMLGDGVTECWGGLPQDIQRIIFETAVREASDDELLREQLAIYLHNHHPRTQVFTGLPREI